MDEQKQASEIVSKATDTAEKVVREAKVTAQVVLSTAKEAAAKVLESANIEPTNRELQETIRKQEETIREHTKEDVIQFESIHARLDMMATTEDIKALTAKLEPILDVYKAVLLSKGFITGLAGIVVAVTAIGVGFAWLVNSVIRH